MRRVGSAGLLQHSPGASRSGREEGPFNSTQGTFFGQYPEKTFEARSEREPETAAAGGPR